jgi:hypothetical protein
MNLWVKRTGQLLAAALFLMSCEDDSFLLGFKNQNKKFNVAYQEFLLGVDEFGVSSSEIIAVDSVTTDNLSGTARLLIGEYVDPIFGSVRTEAFSEFFPTKKTKLAALPSLTYEYDSIVIQLQLDYYCYGLIESTELFKVHRITEDTLSYKFPYTYNHNGKDTTVLKFKRYYANSTIGYDPTPLGEFSAYTQIQITNKEVTASQINLDFDQVKEGKDTLIASIRLEDTFGQELFNVALNDANSEFSNSTKFRTRFKGFAFIPSSESSTVLGFAPIAPYTKVKLFYHSKDNGVLKDTLVRDFSLSLLSFNSIVPTRAAELPPIDPPYMGESPASGLRVLQNGETLVTKIDLNSFYEQFADTIESKIVINSAELVVESVVSETGYAPITSLEARIMKENDQNVEYRIDEDSVAMRGYWLFNDLHNFFALSDEIYADPAAATINYNSSKDKYSGFLTLFIQNLFDNRGEKLPSERLRYLGLYPSRTLLGKSVSRSIFNMNNIKLRIYYTYPIKSNL